MRTYLFKGEAPIDSTLEKTTHYSDGEALTHALYLSERFGVPVKVFRHYPYHGNTVYVGTVTK